MDQPSTPSAKHNTIENANITDNAHRGGKNHGIGATDASGQGTPGNGGASEGRNAQKSALKVVKD